MFRAGLLDLQYGLSRLGCELADELQFGVSKCLHGVILIEINTDIGPHLSGTGGINDTTGCVRKRPRRHYGRAKISHPKQRFHRAGRRFTPGDNSSAVVMSAIGGRSGVAW